MKIDFRSLAQVTGLGSCVVVAIATAAIAHTAQPKFAQLRLVTPPTTPTNAPPTAEPAAALPTQLPPILETAFFRAVTGVEYLDALERAIVAETNRLRTAPASYASELELYLAYFDGMRLELPGLPPIETVEGIAAVEEAIAVLRETDPLPPLTPSLGMSQAALDHVMDMGSSGQSGHYGTDGSDPFERLNRYGQWDASPGNRAGENLSYSPLTLDSPHDLARWHVLQLVVDDGVPSRGHREALLRPNYRQTGVACGEHRQFGLMCSMTYASEYLETE